MGIYVADQNQVGFQYESGTYATPSGLGQWIGLIQNHAPTANTGVTSIRYIGEGTRDVGIHTDGPLDYEGTLTYFPQDWKMIQFALGSIGTANGSIHTFTAIDSNDGNNYTSGTKCPFMSFTLEDGQQGAIAGQNFVRTYKGCMAESITISTAQGEPISVDLAYKAKEMTFSSGAVTAVTASTRKPFMWSHSHLELPSGTDYTTLTDWSLGITNNIDTTHYCNGSRNTDTPKPLNRDYNFTATFQSKWDKAKILYDQYFQGGSEFNALLDVQQAGSLSLKVTMSGCKVTSMDAPSPVEGVNTQSITVVPKKITAYAVDSATYEGF